MPIDGVQVKSVDDLPTAAGAHFQYIVFGRAERIFLFVFDLILELGRGFLIVVVVGGVVLRFAQRSVGEVFAVGGVAAAVLAAGFRIVVRLVFLFERATHGDSGGVWRAASAVAVAARRSARQIGHGVLARGGGQIGT